MGGALVPVASKGVEALLSKRLRRRHHVPDIVNTVWKAEWRFEDDTVFVKDEVTFEKWTKGLGFRGYGTAVHDNTTYKYTITGEISTTRYVILIYKGQDYPRAANIGVACLQLSDNANELEGSWSGRNSQEIQGKKVFTVRGGRLTMIRRETSAN